MRKKSGSKICPKCGHIYREKNALIDFILNMEEVK
jgi:hypothetical protein